MAINERLRRLLDGTRSSYAVLSHPRAYTAQQVAREVQVSGEHLAKVVVIRDEAGKDSMIVIPAIHRVDPHLVRLATGRPGFHLEDQRELKRLFPDCELGAMPPFGALYGLPMYLDPCLLESDDILFQAGNHQEVVMMRSRHFEEIARPFYAGCCLHRVRFGARATGRHRHVRA